MPGPKKLQEEFEKYTKEEKKAKADDSKRKAEEAKQRFFKAKWKSFRTDIYYMLVISVVLGFILWAWKPEMFTFYRALALGLAWMMLFGELQLHKIFRKE